MISFRNRDGRHLEYSQSFDRYSSSALRSLSAAVDACVESVRLAIDDAGIAEGEIVAAANREAIILLEAIMVVSVVLVLCVIYFALSFGFAFWQISVLCDERADDESL